MSSMSIREAIERLVNGISLSEAETVDVMNQIMTGEASPLQVAAFLTALRMKGENVDEITGAARVMREKAHRVNVAGKTVLDTCGTGGDQKGTFNISTTTAFVLAGAGVNVAKHGNRSVSVSRVVPTFWAPWASRSMPPRSGWNNASRRSALVFFSPHCFMKR